jgi:quercetin dioxygenase-like cupin family protein
MGETTVLKRQAQAMTLAVSEKKNARYVDGRRAFFKYRDLGVTDATHGRMRAQVTSTVAPMDRETGWHYHTCEMQFVYMLRGWIDLEFEGGRKVRLEAGDSVMIPGGAPHQETRTSDDFEIVEVSVPAEMGTVNCDPPA